MEHMRPLTLRPLLVLAVLAIGLATPAFADLWYEHYKKGEDALNQRNWKEAIDQFTQAVEKKRDPGMQVRTYGMNFINYHPYLKLGIAYYNLGQLDAALQAFDTEEGFGAIARSPEEKNLASFRKLATEASQTATLSEQERIARIVASALQEARGLEQQRKLDEAMAAVGKALAVDSRNAEAQATMERLRGLVAGQERARDVESRLSGLLADGRNLLSAGKYQEASSTFNQALSLRPDDSVARDLLAQSQAKLREEMEGGRNAASRQALVRDGIGQALREEKAGRLAEALQDLQGVLAVDPENGQALEMQSRMLKAKEAADSLEARSAEIATKLADGMNMLKRGEYAGAITAFNRLMALDPRNPSAPSYLAQAYKGMNSALLGRPMILTRLPPIITIANVEVPASREPGASAEERVSAPDFVLSGSIMAFQPQLKVVFLGDAQPAELALSGSKLGDFYEYHFRQPFSLKPGPVELKIVASDAEGLTAERVHNVRYERPLTRSPWFYPGLALLGAAAVATLQGVRVVRRNRLIKRRFNPYVAGAPVLDDDLFVGREALLSRILQTIHNNSILLYGERRIGKTTLQHHLRRRLQKMQDPDYDFYPVLIDLQGTPQERFFATMAEDIFGDLAPILDGAQARRQSPPGNEYDHNAFSREIYQVLEVLKKRSAKKAKLVLLIDEVDELNNYDPRVNQRLRSLFMKSFAEDLVAVVSGVGIKKEWASEGSPWYNFFEEIEVKPFTRKDAEELIEKPIRGIFKLEQGVVDRIIENTGCKPYLIQKLCVSLVNRMHDEKRRRITLADVEALGRPAEA
jgi:tetratricopeptide (TPR) repeat protein